MKLRLCLAFFALLAVRCLGADTNAAAERFSSLFAGIYSSAEQSLADKNYHNVSVHCIRIWPQRTDGTWFYVEHALADGLDQPYRQRVHQLVTRDDGTLELRVYTPDDLIAVTGAWRKTVPLADLAPKHLTYLEGGSILLHEMPDGSFVGATSSEGYANTLRGATHATSELTLSAEKMTFLERGYSATGRQVWGPTNGAYILKRVVSS